MKSCAGIRTSQESSLSRLHPPTVSTGVSVEKPCIVCLGYPVARFLKPFFFLVNVLGQPNWAGPALFSSDLFSSFFLEICQSI
jgi:hypothetical protein